MMTEQAVAARRAYKREWAARNRDKVRAQQERHWERVARLMQERQQQDTPPDLREVDSD